MTTAGTTFRVAVFLAEAAGPGRFSWLIITIAAAVPLISLVLITDKAKLLMLGKNEKNIRKY